MAAGFDTIDYVKWAQRSLNRIMGRSVPVDGKEIGPWREALGDFKELFNIAEPGLTKFQIGAKAQNELIRMSHLSKGYVAWLQAKLPGAGSPDGLDPAGKLQKAIRVFQQNNPPLKVDGWVGHATEARLLKVYGEPPGNGGPPPAPAPEWLQVWNALPLQVRYAKWIADLAARVGADQQMAGRLPPGGWDPVYKHFLGILAANAKERPKLLHFYFTDLDVSGIAVAPMDRVVNNPPKKAEGGGKLLDEQALRLIVAQMTSTEDLFRLTAGIFMTPEAHSAAQLAFEERVFQTFKSIQSGFQKLAFLGSWGSQGSSTRNTPTS